MAIVNINEVIVGKRLRPVDPQKVEELKKSIKECGLLTPIIIYKNRLVAGAHRLEALKQLGYTQVMCATSAINNTKEDELLFIEATENLIRNELTPSERAKHYEIVTKILAKRYKGKYLDQAIKANASRQRQDEDKLRAKVFEADNFQQDFRQVDEKVAENDFTGDFRPLDEKVTENNFTGDFDKVNQKVTENNFQQDFDKVNQKVAENIKSIIRSAERNALAEAKKEVAVSLGHADTKAINRMIKDNEAVTRANLDESKLNQLNNVQLKEIAKVARKEPEKAKEVLDQQITLNAAKETGSIPKNTSVLTNNPHTKIGKDIGVIQSAKALVKKYSKVDRLSKSDISALEEAEIALEEAIATLKKYRATFDK